MTSLAKHTLAAVAPLTEPCLLTW